MSTVRGGGGEAKETGVKLVIMIMTNVAGGGELGWDLLVFGESDSVSRRSNLLKKVIVVFSESKFGATSPSPSPSPSYQLAPIRLQGPPVISKWV